MSQVTQLSPQKKGKRFNLYLEGQYAFSVSQYSVIEHGLKTSLDLSQKKIDLIISKERSSIFLDLALRYLSVRQRSEKEIRDYLQRKIANRESIKFSEAKNSPVIELTIKKLKKYNYVNDHAFAQWFIKSRIKTKHQSVKLIKYELAKKGVSKDQIENLKMPKINDKKNAIVAVEKKVIRWKSLPPLEFKKKFFQFLAYRGFDYEIIEETFAFYREKR